MLRASVCKNQRICSKIHVLRFAHEQFVTVSPVHGGLDSLYPELHGQSRYCGQPTVTTELCRQCQRQRHSSRQEIIYQLLVTAPGAIKLLGRPSGGDTFCPPPLSFDAALRCKWPVCIDDIYRARAAINRQQGTGSARCLATGHGSAAEAD